MNKILSIRLLYNKVMELAEHRYATAWLGFISFIESMIFPIPPDVLLIPMCISNRQKAWFYASICTIASVMGGAFGYMLGYIFYDSIGQMIVSFYGMEDKFIAFQAYYQEWGIWIVLAAGLTPFPYKIITIASGVMLLDFGLFMLISLIARASRFFLEALLLWYFGEKIRIFIEKYLGILTALFFALLLLGFATLKYL